MSSEDRRWQERARRWPAEAPADGVPATGAVLFDPTPAAAEAPAPGAAPFRQGTLQKWKTVPFSQRGGKEVLRLKGQVRSSGRVYHVESDSSCLAELHEDPAQIADRFLGVLRLLADGTACEFRLDNNDRVIEIRGVPGVDFATPAAQVPHGEARLPPLPFAALVPEVAVKPLHVDSFHNPYAFVAPLPRKDEDPIWGRRPPPPHDVLDPDRLTGEIELELEAVTPYFSALPGARAGEEAQLLEPRDDVPATSLKGAIRAIYEALTNSCFAVFDDSGRRVSHRIRPERRGYEERGGTESRDLEPVRIDLDGDGLRAERMQEARVLAYAGDSVLTSASPHFPHPRRSLEGLEDGRRVWFQRVVLGVVAVGNKRHVRELRGDDAERYEAFFTSEPGPRERARFPDGAEVRRGRVQKLSAPRQVGGLLLPAGTLGIEPIDGAAGQPFYPFRRDERGDVRPKRGGRAGEGTEVWFAVTRRIFVVDLRAALPDQDPPPGYAVGYLRKVGKTIHSKTFESVFFSYQDREFLALPERAIQDYEELVTDTQRLSRGRQEGTEASPYLTDARRRRLHEGLLLYATVQGEEIGSLSTVKIGRALHRTSLREALARCHDPAERPDPETEGPFNAPGSLLPCRHGAWLCPACRLFGWVAQRGVAGRDETGRSVPSAYRGRLRWSSAELVGPRALAIERFTGKAYGDGRGLPLAVLSSPKPNREAFYLRRLDGEGTQQWEDPHSGLAGRKFYWHHERDRGHWQVQPQADPLRFSYRRKDNVSDSQNRVITGWVKPGTRFRSVIHFENLSPEELGALLSCVGLPAGCHLRLGGGKPLGLGSFRIRVAGVRILDLAASYGRLGPLERRVPTEGELRGWIDRFAASLCRAYLPEGAAPSLGEVPFVADLLRVLAGPARGRERAAPIHYPRVTEDAGNPGPEIEWSKAHESTPLPGPRDGEALRRDG